MNFMSIEHFGNGRREMIDDFRLAQIERLNLGHIVFAESEISNIIVLDDAAGMNGLGQNDDAALYIPAQDYLGCRLAIFFTNSR